MRYDIYRRPHKALRALMAETLLALQRADPAQACEVREAQAQLDEMLAFCEAHAALENEFIHRPIEARREKASCRLARKIVCGRLARAGPRRAHGTPADSISAASRPLACAREAFSWLRTAKRSWSARLIWKSCATFSAVEGIVSSP